MTSEWFGTEEAALLCADSQLTGRKQQLRNNSVMRRHFYLHFLFKNLETYSLHAGEKRGDLSSQPPPYPLLGLTICHYLFGFNVPPTLPGWLSAQMVHRLRTRKRFRLLAGHGLLQRDPEAHRGGRGGSRWDRAAGTLWRQLRVRREDRLEYS